MTALHVETWGDHGDPAVLVHGSLGWGAETWAAQRPLAERYRLHLVDRHGFGSSPGPDAGDFERDADAVAELLPGRAHLVGHSYGGVVSLLAAALTPDLLSTLTVIEPPAFGLAADDPAVKEIMAAFTAGYSREPAGYLEFFLPLVGAAFRAPEPLPPALEAGARAAIAERYPSEAEIPFEVLRAAPFRKLVVSGGHHPAFDAVCDVLERELEAERAVIPGAGHSVARTGEPFNRVLVDFVERG